MLRFANVMPALTARGIPDYKFSTSCQAESQSRNLCVCGCVCGCVRVGGCVCDVSLFVSMTRWILWKLAKKKNLLNFSERMKNASEN